MKCHKCDKQAVFHITEMIDAHPKELHLCAEHAYEYLHGGATLKSAKQDPFDLKAATDELVTDDFQTCPCCGLSFQDFRKAGRFGCARDYVVFRDNIEPLIFSMHGASEHVGKRPKREGRDAERAATLVRLRSALSDAVEIEDYERASMIRDQIADLEKESAER